MTSPLVQVEALGPELVHGAVHMAQHAAQTVILVRVALRRRMIRYKKQMRESAGKQYRKVHANSSA